MPTMPLRPTTIRFAPDAMQLVNEAAAELGESTSQFVREAAMMRAMLTLKPSTDLHQLAEEIKQLARRDD